MDAELIKEYLLENFGSEIQINVVTNEADFILAISKDTYDLILADFILHGFDGFAALEHAKSICPSTPFLCVSGFIGEESAVELLKQGATDYILKNKLGRLKYSMERALKESKDQNDLREANLSLIKIGERYKTLTQTSIDGFFILDIEGRFLEVNDAYCKISEYSREILLSMNINDLDFDESDKQTDARVQKIIDKGWDQFNSRHRKNDGTFFNVHNNITFIPNEKLFICFVHDVTDRQKAEEEILRSINHDHLTGLYNRRFYEEELKRLDTKRNFPLTIVMGDINGLKLINDSFGHTMGDELLRKAAGVINHACRADDIIARLGGDEFVIILPKTDAFETERIIKRIKDLSLKEKVGNIEISISFGYATKSNEEENLQEIFKYAEDRMYQHKHSESLGARSKTIDLILNTLYKKTSIERSHSIRVSEVCEAIATKMDFNENDVFQIRTAGLIHDIGKMEIDEKILNKPGKLSKDEWEKKQRHPEIGYRILSAVIKFPLIAEDILEHHERWDGKGYPRGLKGEEISLPSRIIAVADSYDAMTSDRTYDKTLSEEEAINEIMRCSGTQFDPDVAKVFIEKVLGQKWEQLNKI
ncbi:MAG: diguanylate cyclase [Coriobacteriia bacterium]|nr:diguanylate cyclase [Coriobacteriia bacterium]